MTYSNSLVSPKNGNDSIVNDSYYSVVRGNVDLSVVNTVRRLVSFKVYGIVPIEIKRALVRDSL